MIVYESNREVMATRPRAGRTSCALLAITLLIAACGGSEPSLPRIGTTPQATSPASSEGRLSWLRRKAIDRVLDYRVWSGARSGFVAFIATRVASSTHALPAMPTWKQARLWKWTRVFIWPP